MLEGIGRSTGKWGHGRRKHRTRHDHLRCSSEPKVLADQTVLLLQFCRDLVLVPRTDEDPA